MDVLTQYAWIVWLGGGILGYVAGQMILEDKIIVRWLGDVADTLHRPVPIVIGVIIAILGWWLARTSSARKKVPENV